MTRTRQRAGNRFTDRIFIAQRLLIPERMWALCAFRASSGRKNEIAETLVRMEPNSIAPFPLGIGAQDAHEGVANGNLSRVRAPGKASLLL